MAVEVLARAFRPRNGGAFSAPPRHICRACIDRPRPRPFPRSSKYAWCVVTRACARWLTECGPLQFASNGVSGGCQDVYSVYQAPNTTLDDPPVCQNLTYPHSALEVTAETDDGTWSQYGWVDQVSVGGSVLCDART